MAETNVPETSSASNSKYDEAMIKVLNDVEHVRTRPGMYIGGNNVKGLHHLIYEIVDNSIDEALAGFCKNILVKINADGSITISDDGRGIPVGIHPTEKIPTVEVVFATLGAGGKFDHKDGSPYATSGGLHGVGASVVNFLSEWLEVEVNRDGKTYQMEFARGVKSSDLKVIGKASKSGTKVTFKPDSEVFPDIEFKYEMLIGRIRELAFLNQGLRIVVEDERIGKREEFKYDNGLVQYVQSLNEGKIALHPVVYFKKEDTENRLVVEVAMQYSDGFNETAADLRQQHQQPRRRHAPQRLQDRPDRHDQPLRGGQQLDEGHPPQRRRRARGPGRHHQRQAPRAAV